MGRETHIDSIRALEEEIKEHEMALIRLKRARNSLLNVSKLPPELLGQIFHCNVAPKDDFDGLDKGSHNFLLVCHHWFEVASRTSELWSSWGNSSKDWVRWCRRSGTTPLDLVLGNGNHDDSDDEDDADEEDSDEDNADEEDSDEDNADEEDFDKDNADDITALCDALRNRAAQDTIRRVHLRAQDRYLGAILDLLTANYWEPQPNGIESIILRNEGPDSLDVSSFFDHYRFPKLRRLELDYCSTPSWNHLTSRTSVLTTLKLNFGELSSTPTTPQLLSILASNPALQKVGLIGSAVPDDGGGSSVRVKLHQLKELRLEGDSGHVIRLLRQLDHPRNIDNLSLTLYAADITDIPQTIGPYLRNHLQCRDKPQNGLTLHVSSVDPTGYYRRRIKFQAGDAGGINPPAPKRERMNTSVKIIVFPEAAPPKGVLETAALDLITCTPLEEVVYFRTDEIPIALEDVHTRLSNLRVLSFNKVSFPAAFPGLRLIGDGKVFPSLEHILLSHVTVYRKDWNPLKTFLACRMSSGNRLNTLAIVGSLGSRERVVVEGIRDMVREISLS